MTVVLKVKHQKHHADEYFNKFVFVLGDRSVCLWKGSGDQVIFMAMVRGTVVTKAPLRVQFSPALGGRGWERVKAEASPRLY